MLFLTLSGSAHACTCVGTINIENALKEADAVFIGRILSKRTLKIPDKEMMEIFKIN